MKNLRWFISGIALGTLFLTGCNNNEAESTKEEQQEESSPATSIEDSTETSTDANNETANEDSEESTEETDATTALQDGANTVLQSVNNLEQEVNADADSAKIQDLGKEIASNWDSFEKQVEEQYPDWYERIEKNLYPLIAETGKQGRDLEKIKQYSKGAKEDLQSFIKELK
ncbi:hypothetical protein [Peribacillus huizhouensis]|uniref:Gas vesicle protein n=1 Tax=Peribacillus huizhouensis TaxID=1501239 RepID=A0ABR6CV71_9BACI|nr:hypothetical protein [Peribacillus huizhouensis]MBA9028826.1 gas vesicle protein [Peribacillus huizhouensis]